MFCLFCALHLNIYGQVSNPGFESGTLIPSGNNYLLDTWFFAFNENGGEAIPTLDTVIKHSGNRSFKTEVTKTGTPSNPWNIRLDMTSGAFLSFNEDDYVEFSFYARANSSGKQISVKFRDSDNGNWVQEPKTLTTSFNKYTIGQKIPQTRSDYKLTFFLAADTGTFWIDDVSVTALSGSVDVIPAVYHVSPDGDDGNPGTEGAPFQTLGKVSEVINGNDSVYLHEGVYRGDLILDYKVGDTEHPIVIRSWPGDQVTIDGTMDIVDGWIDEGGGIYSREMEVDIWGLYFRDSMMMAARWPNSSIYDFNFFNQKETYRDMATSSSLGIVHDARPFNNELSEYYDIPLDGSFGYIRAGYNEQSLAETGVSMEGAVAVMNAGSWLTWATEITSHQAGSNMFEYDSMFSASGTTRNQALKWTRPREEQSTPTETRLVDDLKERINRNHCHYYIEGLPCLDSPGEWWYDADTRTLWFYPPGNQDPNGNTVKVKIKDYSVKGTLAEYVKLSEIDFYATTFQFEAGKAITIESCNFYFPGHSRRVLGDHDVPKISSFNNKNNPEPTEHRLINCSFEYFDGNGVEFRGGGYNLIENVLLHDYNFSCIGEGKGMITSAFDTIRRVTIYNAGGSEGIDVKDGAVGEYNHLHHFGSLQHDGAGFQTFFKEAPVTYRYNWSHTTLKGGLRFDDGGGLPQPPSYSGQMSHNVSWTSGGFQIKGDSNLINNNLLFNTKDGLEVMVHVRMNGINTHSITVNNMADWILNNGWERKAPPGYLGSNVVAGTDSVRRWMRDPDNWDFRPVYEDYVYEKGEQVVWCSEGSNKAGFCFNYNRPIPKIDSFPDLGPYESGMDNYWIPGFQYPHASTPVPRDKGISNAEFVDLMWLFGYRSEASDVYFGTSEAEVAGAGTGSAAYMGQQTNNIFYPGPLQEGQTYYWRIDAIRGGKKVKGPVWNFTAGTNANPTAYTVNFKVYSNRQGEVHPLQGAEVSLGSRQTITDDRGEANLAMIKPGDYSYLNTRKGFLPRESNILIESDTSLTDTLEFTSYRVDILVLDEDSNEPVGNCLVELGGFSAETGEEGTADFQEVEYGFYSLLLSAKGYQTRVFDDMEIYSDTSLVLTLARNYLQVSLKLIDRVSGDPIYRAQLSYKGLLKLTNSSGEVELDKIISGYWHYEIEHADYFTLNDSLLISNDTALVLGMTRTVASIQFKVSDSVGPVNGAVVQLGSLTVPTNNSGEAMFLNFPARQEHIYRVDKEGYIAVHDTLWLEIDTVITVLLQEPLSNGLNNPIPIGIYPNPASKRVYLDLPFKEAVISIVSMEGRVLKIHEVYSEKSSLDLSNIPGGLYYLRIRNAQNTVQRKIVVLK